MNSLSFTFYTSSTFLFYNWFPRAVSFSGVVGVETEVFGFCHMLFLLGFLLFINEGERKRVPPDFLKSESTQGELGQLFHKKLFKLLRNSPFCLGIQKAILPGFTSELEGRKASQRKG